VQEQLEEIKVIRLLDLFSGSGNLSETFVSRGGERVLIDSYIDSAHTSAPENFHPMDLYLEQSLPNFIRKTGNSSFDALLVDPPRRGFPLLDSWVKKIKPRYIVYVSCNPASLARDLRKLDAKFRIKTTQLLDLFPATAHFETLVTIEIRKSSR
jgi:23S rRNA (uracil1939-C5)-methyltransferase